MRWILIKYNGMYIHYFFMVSNVKVECTNKIFSEQYVAAISIFWAVLIAILLVLKRHTLVALEINAIGDFLAGAFAPLGFFWLVAGFYQQGKGLDQNSEALKLQAKELKASTDALNLQANELKNSVQEQKNLLIFQQKEKDAKHFEAMPHLVLSGKTFSISDKQHEIYGDDDSVLDVVCFKEGRYELIILNEGEVAKSLSIIDTTRNQVVESKAAVNKNTKYDFPIYLFDHEIDKLENTRNITFPFSVQYYDKYGKKYEFSITVEIYGDPEHLNFYYVSIKRYAE